MLNIVFIIIGAVCVIFSLITLSFKINNLGVMIPLISGGGMIAFGLIDVYMLQHFVFWNGISILVTLLFCTEILVVIFISSIMFFGFERFHGDCHGETVIILGCRVRGNKPSKMLTRRLEYACEILGYNTDLICVVSGGQGEDEEFAEALVMKNFLVERGISKYRIIEESRSRNTLQNLQLSAELIEQENLSKKVLIVTDFYHQYRANLFAYRCDLESKGASCRTNPALAFNYWVREILATIQTFILQH